MIAIFGTGIGNVSNTFTLLSSAGFSTYSLTFTPATTSTYVLSFENNGGDNLGALLDRVVVESVLSPVPEPETYAMLLAGLGLLGYAARRRQRKAA